MTNYERIKNMSIEEMEDFLKSMVDENETHEVACYGCINYGTHHSDPKNKGTNLYECESCSCEGIGHDLVKWLESEVQEMSDKNLTSGYVINTEGSWGKPRRKYCEECGAKMPEVPDEN